MPTSGVINFKSSVIYRVMEPFSGINDLPTPGLSLTATFSLTTPDSWSDRDDEIINVPERREAQSFSSAITRAMTFVSRDT